MFELLDGNQEMVINIKTFKLHNGSATFVDISILAVCGRILIQ